MKKKLKELIPYILIIILVIVIRSYIITPVVVVGTSMDDTLKENEILLLSKISYRIKDIKRYDIVVVDNEIHDRLIKRVIGLPGDSIEYRDNKLFINNKYVKEDYTSSETNDFTLKDICNCKEIPKDYYLVLGDNREVSIDSRSSDVGLVKKDDIVGKTIFRFWPLNKISVVK